MKKGRPTTGSSYMITNEFDIEIQKLSDQLRFKIRSLSKDYKDLKLLQNDADIAAARTKLRFFIARVIKDTEKIIQNMATNFDKNRILMIKIDKRMDQI